MKRLMQWVSVSAAVLCLMAPAFADTVTFTNGDRLSGRIVGEEAGKVILEVPGIGEVQIDADRIVTTEVETALLEEDLQTTVEVLAEEVKDDAKSPWSAQLDLGATYVTGNTERVGFTFRFTAKRETKDDIFSVMFWAIYTEDDGNRTENEQIIAIREDLLFEDWYLFGGVNFERDEFERIDLRAQFFLGAGTWIYKKEKATLKVETAPAVTYEDYTDLDSEYKLEWIFALWGEWQVLDSLTIRQWVRWIPDLSNTPEWRMNSLTEFETPLSETVFAKLGISYDYNTNPAPDAEKGDLRVILSVVVRF